LIGFFGKKIIKFSTKKEQNFGNIATIFLHPRKMADEERKGGHYGGRGGRKLGLAKRVEVHVRVCVFLCV
jgi:hypothetical protein